MGGRKAPECSQNACDRNVQGRDDIKGIMIQRKLVMVQSERSDLLKSVFDDTSQTFRKSRTFSRSQR